jgi:putative membrane protein
MLATVVLPWIHYLAVLMMAGGAVAELYLLKLSPTPETVRLLPRVDRFYGITAVLTLVTGILRMYHGGKGADWYWHNGLMHGVITVFIVAGLISIVPTLRFLRWNKALGAGGALPDADAVRKTKILVHVQLTLVALIALMITLVARGYGGR